MATWIVHLRIADLFIKENIIPQEYKTEFVCGSLAPDCGYGAKDSFGEFTPPPTITHWTPSGCKIFCEYDRFYDTYLKDREKNSDYYFYLGYYSHLITDVLWSTAIYMPTRFKYAQEYKDDPLYLNTIKKDWYGLDFEYLANTPDFEPYKLLCNANDVSDYLPYYEPGQLTKQLKFVADYYQNAERNTSHAYKFLTSSEVEQFIKTASELIKIKI